MIRNWLLIAALSLILSDHFTRSSFAITYDESIHGDLSDDLNFEFGVLDIGTNAIRGTSFFQNGPSAYDTDSGRMTLPANAKITDVTALITVTEDINAAGADAEFRFIKGYEPATASNTLVTHTSAISPLGFFETPLAGLEEFSILACACGSIPGSGRFAYTWELRIDVVPEPCTLSLLAFVAGSIAMRRNRGGF